MAEHTTTRLSAVPRVLDKYMLPKVAFVIITVASLSGAWLTGLRQGLAGWPLLLRWAAYWVLGLLLGSELWKLAYLRPSVRSRPAAAAVEYAEAMLRLHRTWQRVLMLPALLLVLADLALVARRPAVPWGWLAMAAAAVIVAAVAALAGRTPGDWLQATRSWLLLAALAATEIALAAVDVTLAPSGNPWLLVPVRVLHLWAFSAWLGGALWNIFIAVPAGMSRVNLDTVILANFQLERFRVVVRTAFATIVATGLLQTWAIFGWHWRALLFNTWGHLVLIKLGLIAALLVVFITCPMWRACSPIRGVCDLDDL